MSRSKAYKMPEPQMVKCWPLLLSVNKLRQALKDIKMMKKSRIRSIKRWIIWIKLKILAFIKTLKFIKAQKLQLQTQANFMPSQQATPLKTHMSLIMQTTVHPSMLTKLFHRICTQKQCNQVPGVKNRPISKAHRLWRHFRNTLDNLPTYSTDLVMK